MAQSRRRNPKTRLAAVDLSMWLKREEKGDLGLPVWLCQAFECEEGGGGHCYGVYVFLSVCVCGERKEKATVERLGKREVHFTP